eukprot:g9744.t1
MYLSEGKGSPHSTYLPRLVLAFLHSSRSHRENFNAGQNKRDLPGDGGTFDSEGFVDEILDRSKLGLSLAQRKKAEERVKLPEKPALTHIYGEDDFLLRTD